MLIDKGIAVNEIISLKIISGEEIVGRLVEETGVSYKISKPTLINITDRGLMLTPYLFSADMEKPIEVFKSAVVSIFLTEKAFADQYIQGTTGIQL
jgi:hypothetical protein